VEENYSDECEYVDINNQTINLSLGPDKISYQQIAANHLASRIYPDHPDGFFDFSSPKCNFEDWTVIAIQTHEKISTPWSFAKHFADDEDKRKEDIFSNPWENFFRWSTKTMVASEFCQNSNSKILDKQKVPQEENIVCVELTWGDYTTYVIWLERFSGKLICLVASED
jgi:hypothetical protein